MKTLLFANEEFGAERIVKDVDSITGYKGNIVVFKFSGIKDFNHFTLTNEQEFDQPEMSEVEKLRVEQAQANAELIQLIMMMGGGFE